jgi:hypothetical protein
LESVSQEQDAVEIGGYSSKSLFNTFLINLGLGVIKLDLLSLNFSLAELVPALHVNVNVISLKSGSIRR